MIKNTTPYGKHKRLNFTSEILCDSCSVNCTDEFYEIYLNKMTIEDTTTAVYPWSQQSLEPKQYCKVCITQKT